MPGPCAVRRCGYAGQISTCRLLFQEREIVLFFTWQLPTDRWLLVAPFACISLVRSLTWSISDVKHGSGCGGRDPLRPMPAHEDHQGQRRAPTNSSAPCWQLRYMSVSRRWNVAAARACHADHCEVWETTSSSFCVACSSYSTSQLRKVIAWRRPVRLCRSLRSGGGRIIRPGHQHSDPDEGATQRSKTDKTPLIRPNSSCGRRRPVPDISLADVVCAETKSQGFLPSRCRQWPWRTSYKA